MWQHCRTVQGASAETSLKRKSCPLYRLWAQCRIKPNQLHSVRPWLPDFTVKSGKQVIHIMFYRTFMTCHVKLMLEHTPRMKNGVRLYWMIWSYSIFDTAFLIWSYSSYAYHAQMFLWYSHFLLFSAMAIQPWTHFSLLRVQCTCCIHYWEAVECFTDYS